MQKLLGNNILNGNCLLISSQNVSQKFFYYKKNSARWYRKCKAVWCKALVIVIRLQWNINFIARFSKNPQTFRDKLFNVEGQTERGMGMMSVTVVFQNFGTSLQKWHRYMDGLRNFCNSYNHNIWYHLTIFPVTTAIHTIYP